MASDATSGASATTTTQEHMDQEPFEKVFLAQLGSWRTQYHSDRAFMAVDAIAGGLYVTQGQCHAMKSLMCKSLNGMALHWSGCLLGTCSNVDMKQELAELNQLSSCIAKMGEAE